MRREDPFLPQGRVLARFDTLIQRQQADRARGKQLLETDQPVITSRTVTRADHTDRARLRGIPVAGFGGAIAGTSPHQMRA